MMDRGEKFSFLPNVIEVPVISAQLRALRAAMLDCGWSERLRVYLDDDDAGA